jgi:glycogen synthase
MKILVLTNLYPPHHAGTYDVRCESVTEALRLRGHTVRVLTSSHGIRSDQRGGEVERCLALNGVFEHPLVTAVSELRTLETHNHQMLRETIASFQPDLIHVFSLHGLSKSLIFTLRNSRLPVVYDIADVWMTEELRNDPWLKFWNTPEPSISDKMARAMFESTGQRTRLDETAPTRMMKGYDRVEIFGMKPVAPNSIAAFRFDRLYFCSEAMRDTAVQAGFRVSHAEVIYPGLSARQVVGEMKPANMPLSKFLVVGRLDQRSGLLTALKAMEILLNQNTKASLGIYGRGDSAYMAEVRSYIAMQHLPVEFLPVSNMVQDLPAVYQRHDALLHTVEWNEPFSLTPLEAAACGLPIIMSDAGGVREVLRDREHCLAYAPGDAASLAEKMQELMGQPALRCQIAENAQQEVLSKFNETAVMDRIENYLQTSLETWAHEAS